MTSFEFHCVRACVFAVLFWTCLGVSEAAEARTLPETKESIAAAVAVQRGSLSSSSIEGVSKRLQGPENSVAMSRVRVVISGDAFAVHSSPCGETAGVHCVHNITVWDGESGTEYNSVTNTGRS